jgi:hypothetical protein
MYPTRKSIASPVYIRSTQPIVKSVILYLKGQTVPFDQYHEPPAELPDEIRSFARMLASLIEEADAIGWYEQRMAVEHEGEACAIMRNAQKEEFKHFVMDLEWLLRRKPVWRELAQQVLFKDGTIVELGEEAEHEAVHDS